MQARSDISEINDDFYNLCIRCITNECTDDDRRTLKHFLKDQAYAATYDAIQESIHVGKESIQSAIKQQDYIADHAWTRLEARQFTADERSRPHGFMSWHYVQSLLTAKAWGIISIAAILLLCTLSALIFDTNAEITELATAEGEVLTFTLYDGTTVTLNSNSRLRVDNRAFGKQERLVQLEGEAYFDVVPNPDSPFIVESEYLKTSVLGTMFYVQAYPEDTKHNVSLVEGSVAVTVKQDTAAEAPPEVVLQPGTELILDAMTELFNVQTVDIKNLPDWRYHHLNFIKTPLPDVLAALEAKYGVKFELAGDSIEDIRVNARFREDESLKEILSLLSFSIPINVDYIAPDGERVRITYNSRK